MTWLVNQQIDQMNQAGGVASGFTFLQKLVDPLQELHENAQKFYKRVKPHRMISFFNESYDALKNGNSMTGNSGDKYQREIKGLLDKLVDYNSGASVDRLDLSGNLSTDTFDFLLDEFKKFEGTANEFFDSLIEDRVEGDLRDAIIEFLVDDMGEILEDLDENMEDFMEKRGDEWEDYEKSARDSFRKTDREHSRLMGNMGRGMTNFVNDSQNKLLALVALLESTDIKNTISDAASEEIEGIRNLETAIHSHLVIPWGDYVTGMRRDSRDLFREYQKGYEGMRGYDLFTDEDFLKAQLDLISAGIRDVDKILELSIPLMEIQKVFDSIDVKMDPKTILQYYDIWDDGVGVVTRYTDALMALSSADAGLWGIQEAGIDNLNKFLPTLRLYAQTNEELEEHLLNLSIALAGAEAGWNDSASTMEFFNEIMKTPIQDMGELQKRFSAVGLGIGEVDEAMKHFNIFDMQELLHQGKYDEALEVMAKGFVGLYETFDVATAESIIKATGGNLELARSFASAAGEGKMVGEAVVESMNKAREVLATGDYKGFGRWWLEFGARAPAFFDKMGNRLKGLVKNIPILQKVADGLAEAEISFLDLIRGATYAKVLFGGVLGNVFKSMLFGKFGLVTGFKLLLGKGLLGGMGAMVTSIFTGKLGLITLGKTALFGKFGLVTGVKLLLGKALLPAVGGLFAGISTSVMGIGSGLLGLLPVLAPIAGIAWAIWDSFRGVGKSVEWLGEEAGDTLGGKIVSGIGGALGGTDSGLNGALKGAAKGAAIGMIFGPVGAGIGAVIGGVLGYIGGEKIAQTLYSWGETISEWASGIWGSVVERWDETKESLGKIGDWWNEKVSDPIVSGVENIKSSFSERWSDTKDWWNENVSKPLSDSSLWGVGSRIVSSIRDSFTGRWDNAKNWWNENIAGHLSSKSLLGVGSSIVGSIKDSFVSRWDDAKNWWSENISSHIDGASLLGVGISIVRSIRDSFVERWDNARNWWNENVVNPLSGEDSVGLSEVAKNIVLGIRDSFSERWDNAKNWWEENVTSKLGDTELLNIGRNIVSSIRNSFLDRWDTVKSWWSENVTNPLAEGSDLLSIGKDIVSSIRNSFSERWDDVRNWWDENISSPLSDGESLYDVGKKVVLNIRGSFLERWDDAKNWWEENVTSKIKDDSVLGVGISIADGIKDSFSDRWDNVKSWWSENVSDHIDSESLLGVGSSLVLSIRNSFSDRWDDARNWWSENVSVHIDSTSLREVGSDIVSSIRGSFSSRFSDVSDWWGKNVKDPLSDGTFDSSVLLGTMIEDFQSGFRQGMEDLKDTWDGIGSWWDKTVTTPLITYSDGTVVTMGTIWEKSRDSFKNSWAGIAGWWRTTVVEPIQNIWVTMINTIVDAINVVIGSLNTLGIKVPDWVPLIGGKEWGFDIAKVSRISSTPLPEVPPVDVTPAVESKTPSIPVTTEDHRLGSLSAWYESENRGAGTVANTKGDIGGASYGTYQIATNTGTMDRFMSFLKGSNTDIYDFLSGAGAYGSDRFSEAWKIVANMTGDLFGDLQHEFIQKSHYDPALRQIKDTLGLDLSTRSHAVQDALWSTAVQHGARGALRIFENAGILPHHTDEEIIRMIYGERGKDDGRAYFGSNSDSVRQSVVNRFIQEEKDALAMLESIRETGQSSIPAAATGGVLTVPRLVLAGERGPEALIPLDKFSGLDFMGESIQSYLAQIVEFMKNIVSNVEFGLPVGDTLAYDGGYGMSSVETGEGSPTQVISDNSDVVEIIKWSTMRLEKKFDDLIEEERRQKKQEEIRRETRKSRSAVVLSDIINFE